MNVYVLQHTKKDYLAFDYVKTIIYFNR